MLVVLRTGDKQDEKLSNKYLIIKCVSVVFSISNKDPILVHLSCLDYSFACYDGYLKTAISNPQNRHYWLKLFEPILLDGHTFKKRSGTTFTFYAEKTWMMFKTLRRGKTKRDMKKIFRLFPIEPLTCPCSIWSRPGLGPAWRRVLWRCPWSHWARHRRSWPCIPPCQCRWCDCEEIM